jgi:hypothetical protein
MTKKDYIKIAHIIKSNMTAQTIGQDIHGNTVYDIGHSNRIRMINELCGCFKEDNPKFDEIKFKHYINN